MEKLKQYWQSIVFIIVIIGVISTLSYSYDLCHGDATISQLQKYSVAAVPFYKLGISAILLVIAFLLLILPNLKDVLMISCSRGVAQNKVPL